MTTLEVLQKAKALIEPPNRWTKGWGWWKEGEGQTCAVGAVRVIGGINVQGCSCPECCRSEGIQGAITALGDVIGAKNLAQSRVVQYNDSHNHECVMQMFDAAIAAEQAKA